MGLSISPSRGLMLSGGVSVGVATPAAPSNVSIPVITGTALVGETLSCSTGTWTGVPTPTFTYQWQDDGVDIDGATSSTYELLVAQDGGEITCEVTATNSEDSATAESAATAAVDTPEAPTNTVAPAVTGDTAAGDTLSVTNGTWTAVPAISGYTYQWQSDTVDIDGATSATFVLTVTQEDTTVRCVVTATNTEDSVAANSNGVSIPDPSPPAADGIDLASGDNLLLASGDRLLLIGA